MVTGTATADPSQDKIIISGASGQLGKLVVKALLARGVPAQNLILVSRTPDSLAEFAKLGAATRAGHLEKPETLAAAYAGGTRLLLISVGLGGSLPRPTAHKNGIDAAKAAGVKQIAYTSFVAITKGVTDGLSTDHFKTEEFLKASGVPYTFLRNSIYQDFLLGAATKMVADGKALVPKGESRLGYVTRGDCAAAAAAVLSPGHDNKAYDITGPELLGTREIAAAASEVSGKKIEVVTGDPNAPAAPTHFGGPSVEVVSSAVKDLTGQAPKTLRALLTANKDKLLAGGK